MTTAELSKLIVGVVGGIIIAALALPGRKAKFFGVGCGCLALAVVLIVAFAGGIHSEQSAGTGTPTPAPTVSVTFNEYATTTFGTNVYITGNVAGLGNWKPATARELSSASYPFWSITLTLPANTTIDYKYIKKDSSGNVTWENGANRRIITGTAGSTGYAYKDTWQ